LSLQLKAGSPNFWGAVIIGVVLLCVISLTALKSCQTPPCLNVDPSSNCPKCANSNYESTIILVDQTDTLTESQFREVEKLILGLVEDLSEFEKVSIFAIDTISDDVPLPLFEKCIPRNPRDIDEWRENPREIRERYNKGFLDPFREDLISTFSGGSHGTSPIIETIQSVVSNHGLDNRITDRHLIIVSDLMQNVPGYDHYRNDFDYRAYKATPHGKKSGINLVGVSVQIIYLWRPAMSPVDVDRHLLFWENFIEDNGGWLRSVQKVK